ncbi:hypothetical protein C8Q72DRAFT_819558 [Fomitopsis betulina]|nr:hypothetical protein C8Q72DRAFT_819558 [Fomitopsis betulina]
MNSSVLLMACTNVALRRRRAIVIMQFAPAVMSVARVLLRPHHSTPPSWQHSDHVAVPRAAVSKCVLRSSGQGHLIRFIYLWAGTQVFTLSLSCSG